MTKTDLKKRVKFARDCKKNYKDDFWTNGISFYSITEIDGIVKTLSPDGKLEDSQKVQQSIIDKINASNLLTKIFQF